MNLESGYFDFHGKLTTIVDIGTLSTERDGLQSNTSIYKIQKGLWAFLPKRKSKHPIFWNMTVDRAEVSFSGPFAIATCTFFGIETEESDAVYDLCDNVNEEPIATHPDFVKVIGGTPDAPLHGANFRKAGVNGVESIVSAAKFLAKPELLANVKADPSGYVFDHFDLTMPKPQQKDQNPFSKVEAYLEPGITWRKSWCRRKPIEDLSDVGKIAVPEGNYPQLGGQRNWLVTSFTQQQKGACFQCTKEWRASGRRGWIPEIYAKK